MLDKFVASSDTEPPALQKYRGRERKERRLKRTAEKRRKTGKNLETRKEEETKEEKKKGGTQGAEGKCYLHALRSNEMLLGLFTRA